MVRRLHLPGRPGRVAARHDFWNVALSTMALCEHLYRDNHAFTHLPEVSRALDRVFPIFRDAFETGSTGAWSSTVP